MQQRPLYWASLIFAFGFVSSNFFLSRDSLPSLIVMIVIVGSVAVITLIKHWKESMVCLVIWVLGVSYYAIYDRTHLTHLESSSTLQAVEGKLISSVKIDGDIMRFTFQIKKVGGISVDEKTECRVPLKNLTEYKQAHLLQIGSTLKFSSSILAPDIPRNPGTFDYKQYLYYKGIHWILRPTSFSALIVTPPPSSDVGFRLEQIQMKLAQIVDELYPSSSRGMIKGLVLGVREDIPAEIMDTYSRLGLVHVLAISGLHMSILIGGLLKLMRIAGFTQETGIAVTMVFILGYIVLVGATPSVTRAGIMAILLLLGHYLHRPRDGLNLWGTACLLMLLFDPYQIWDVGFQLSFIVTWGLLILTAPLSERLPISYSPLRSLVAVTLSAQLVSMPIVLFYFHQFHFLSPLINLGFVPLFSLLVIPLGFISLVLGFIHPSLSFLVTTFLTSALGWMNTVLYWMAEKKFLQFYFSSPSLWWSFFYYLGLSLMPRVLQRSKWVYPLFFSIVALLILPLFYFEEEKVVITFLDVGQGDAIVIQTPDHVYLIDTGGAPLLYNEGDTWKNRADPFDPGKRIIVPFLKSKGIEQIDTVFITHGDRDHIGGLHSVLKEMRVDQVVGNGRAPSTTLEEELITFLKENSIPLYWGKRGARWQDGPDITWTILNPGENLLTTDNNQSIVLLLEAFGRRILFTGDLEKEGEQELLSSDLVASIDVLKVGHHGSRSSTKKEWVERLKPHLSVISVGKRNRFGHPHPDTLSTLTEFGSRILRTDQVGSITLEISKENWNVTTFLQLNGENMRHKN